MNWIGVTFSPIFSARAAVQVAEVGSDFRDHLAVGAQDEAQHAVRAGVLRTHIDQHLIGSDIELDDGRVGRLLGGHEVVSGVATLRWSDGIISTTRNHEDSALLLASVRGGRPAAGCTGARVVDPFARWEKNIAAIEKRLKADPAEAGRGLLRREFQHRPLGSEKWFPDKDYVNVGFGGSVIKDNRARVS